MDLSKLESVGEEIKNRLIDIRDRVGAQAGTYNPVHKEFITGKDLHELSLRCPGEPIIIDGEFYLVYIKDNRHLDFKEYEEDVKNNPTSCFVRGKKVHFYHCRTLTQMEERGRKRRYRQYMWKNDNHTRIIDLKDKDDVYTRLPWCQNCLSIFIKKDRSLLTKDIHIMAQDYDTKKLMKSVMADYDNRHPLKKPFVADLEGESEPSGYPENWPQISAKVRKNRGYKCECCGVDCSAHDHKALIDVHHKDGNRWNSDERNLECLCKLCHAKQLLHEHYNPKENHKQTLRQLQSEQNIPMEKRG